MKKIHGRIMAMLGVVLIAASLNSCHKMLNCLHGNGNPIIEERAVRDFYMITPMALLMCMCFLGKPPQGS